MTKNKKQDGRKNNGGARPGAGRKRILIDREDHQVSLDKPTRETIIKIGEGELSLGIRRSSRIISRQFTIEEIEILIEEDKRIEHKKQKEDK